MTAYKELSCNEGWPSSALSAPSNSSHFPPGAEFASAFTGLAGRAGFRAELHGAEPPFPCSPGRDWPSAEGGWRLAAGAGAFSHRREVFPELGAHSRAVFVLRD